MTNTLLEQAAAIVGLVAIYHASALPLPSIRPFTCGFCTCIWVAICWFSWSEGITNGMTVLAGTGIVGLIAGVISSMTPLFRASEPKLPPLPDEYLETVIVPFGADTTKTVRRPLLPPSSLP